MGNDLTVPVDGVYTIWFRPDGDGTAEDGWEWIHFAGDGDKCDESVNHGATRGGFMYKFEKTADLPQ
jgi:hypothetical protein